VNSTFDQNDGYFSSLFHERNDLYNISVASCYCVAHLRNISYPIFLNSISVDDNDMKSVVFDPSLTENCKRFSYVMAGVSSIQMLTDNSVVAINFMLRFIVIWVIKNIGYKTRSEETS
jgi:hypothetical protein